MFELTLRRREYLVESAPKKATKSVVDNLQKNDRLLVYHGTYNKEFEIMANGIDALRIRSRSYNQGNHNGLFVAPDMNTAARFGRIVLEMSLPVRSMHGPETWGGEISGKKGDDVWKDIYPKSFRPSLSASLSTRGEPQALYLGFVRPKDILGVYMMDSVNKPGPRMTLKEAKVRFKVEDVGVDLTNPRFSISDYVKMLKYPVAKIKAAILRYKPKSPDDIYDLIAGGGFGEHSFGEKALKNLVNQMYKQWVLLESRFRRRAYLVESVYDLEDALDALHPALSDWVYRNDGNAKRDLLSVYRGLSEEQKKALSSAVSKAFSKHHGKGEAILYRRMKPGQDLKSVLKMRRDMDLF